MRLRSLEYPEPQSLVEPPRPVQMQYLKDEGQSLTPGFLLQLLNEPRPDPRTLVRRQHEKLEERDPIERTQARNGAYRHAAGENDGVLLRRPLCVEEISLLDGIPRSELRDHHLLVSEL